MKLTRLYTKILVSFILVLIVTEIFVFGLFILAVGKVFRSRVEKYTYGKVLLARELLLERAKVSPGVPIEDNARIGESVSHLAKILGVKIWISSPDGMPIYQSFEGDVPEKILRLTREKDWDNGHFEMYSRFHRGAGYMAVPLKPAGQGPLVLHYLSEGMDKPPPKGRFLLGLAVIGGIVALLVIPVSRRISGPVNRLTRTARSIARGDLSRRVEVTTKDEIGELGSAFNTMADRVERMIRGGKELTAHVSHELRSPLARIRVAVELIENKLDGKSKEAVGSRLDQIREDIEELDRLIGQILTYSKLDLRQDALKHERFDATVLLEELLDRFRPFINEKGLFLEIRFQDNPVVSGDADAVRTAFSNLLDNAVKFTPEGGRVIVEAFTDGGDFVFRISNTFDAIDEGDLAEIFEPFHRNETVAAPGYGLGLAITKRIVERHGGSIEASNSEDGFTIRMRLPLDRPDP